MNSEFELPDDLPELRGKFASHDFFVDFLGALVPGMLFLLGLALILLPTLHAVFVEFLGQPRVSLGSSLRTILESTQNTPNTLWIIGFFVIVAISYVVGHLFYRRDPKKPNQHSFRKLTKGKSPDELVSDYACSSADDCEFPYPFFDAYLVKRGHEHLLPLVRWKKDHRDQRSKTYVNMLKIRLRYHCPHKCSSIIRNEGHVRLATSTWYVTRALRYCFAIIAIPLFGILLYLLARQAPVAGLFAATPTLIPPLAVAILSEFGRDRIEKFLHYQRMREVFFVLETAYTAFRDQPELLNPPFDEFVAAMPLTGAEPSPAPDG
jgi:hypothetical protein